MGGTESADPVHTAASTATPTPSAQAHTHAPSSPVHSTTANVRDTVRSSQSGVSEDHRIRELETKIRLIGVMREVDVRNLQRELLMQAEQVDSLRKDCMNLEQGIERSEKLAWTFVFQNVPARPIISTKIKQCSTDVVDFTSKILETHPDILDQLKTPDLDIWKLEDDDMMVLLEVIFNAFGLASHFNVAPRTLRKFISTVRINYRKNAFHSFTHAFCVTQMLYSIFCVGELDKRLTKMDLIAALTAALCHDLDHPGFNNVFQVNALTELAIRYNDISPLENHHAATAFAVLKAPGCNIFENVDRATYLEIRKIMIGCVLSTDMARHGDIMAKWKEKVESLNCEVADDRALILQLLIKMSDVSNEARPLNVSEPWVDCLLKEFFNQSDLEKKMGLPVAPFMDRDKVTKSHVQISFIQFVLLPLFESVAKAFPRLQDPFVRMIRESHKFYTKMKEAEELEKSSSAPGPFNTGHNGHSANKLVLALDGVSTNASTPATIRSPAQASGVANVGNANSGSGADIVSLSDPKVSRRSFTAHSQHSRQNSLKKVYPEGVHQQQQHASSSVSSPTVTAVSPIGKIEEVNVPSASPIRKKKSKCVIL